MSSLRVRSVTVGLATGLDSQNNLIIRQPSISNSVVSFSRFDSSGNVVADVVSFNTLTGSVTFENPIIASITGNAATVTDGVYTSRSINTNNGLSGGGNLSADRTLGLTGQALALHNLSTNGVITRTGSGTVAARTITGTTNQVIVTNGDGVSGNPTLSLPQNIHTSASPTFAGATLNGNLGIRASSTSSVATQIPVFIADPASTTRTISTRTPAQLRSDIGVNDGTLTMNVSGTGLTGSQTFTANQSSAATFTVTSNATSANTVNTIVARDASGDFSAGSITASALNGVGVSSGTNTFTLSRGTSTLVRSGAHALTLTTTAASNVTLPTSGTLATTAQLPTVNDGTLTMSVSGTGLTGSQTFTANQSSAATFTVTSNATSANTVNTIVARDASGNFSAGTITASLSGTATTANATAESVTFNNGGAGAASGTTFNGSTARTISHNTIGAAPITHSHTITWTAGTTAGPTLSVQGGAAVAIPIASNSASGVVTTAAQTFAGAKTFNSTVQTTSLGVGTAPSGTTGEIRATNNITAYFSDNRLKTRVGTIENALSKVKTLTGFYYVENETAKSLGYSNDKIQVGVSAQEVMEILPEVVVDAPINSNFEGADYKTVQYDKLVPLLIEAIKELELKIDKLQNN